MTNVIKGSGGGGKGGGGGGRVAIEAPNTLQSVQYARVLDLVSEGEIEGLVNGLQSVYINDTPLLNASGSYNFSGVTFDYRKGTQSQDYISGFPAIENEVAVGTEVTNALPVTRSITNPNINAVRVTMSVPSLTLQDTTNGDLNGTSVHLQLYYQNNNGGFVPARVAVESFDLSVSGNNASSGDTNILSANLSINWVGITNFGGLNPYTGEWMPEMQYCYYLVQYRSTPSGSWTDLYSGAFSGARTTTQYLNPDRYNGWGNPTYLYEYTAPTGSNSVSFNAPTEGTYEFRVIKLSGQGEIGLAYGSAQYYSPNIYISGKTTSAYQRSYRLELPVPGPWDIRLYRVTADSTQASLQNKTYFDSFTEIIDAKLSYPNSAVFGVQVDARQFNSIPSRAYEIYGIKVKVPDNYDPFTRTYTGEWSGDFKIAWTNNPAWIFYDIVTNDRYGLGEFINADAVDKWGLYSIAQYCDEMVSTGLGGVEPRFTCNAFIQTRYEAYDLINQLASIFRAMTFWSQGQITCVQDRPSDTVALFTSANVVDGQFNYSGSSVKSRHTVCLVTWNDPLDRYKQKVEYVEDVDGIARYGVIQTEVQAFGCTSRGQAHRLGKWLLFSERLETETVSFKAGIQSALIYPGAIIHTQDQFRSGKRFGGRLFGSSTTELKLDSSVEIEAGKTYEVSVILPDNTVHSVGITNTEGTYSSLIPVTALPAVPVDGAMWVLSASDLKPEEWRVIGITESEPGIAEITALASRQDKYDAVEKGLLLEPIPSTSVSIGTSNAVTNLSVTEALYLVTSSVVGNSATVSWTGNSPNYILTYSTENSNPVQIDVRTNSYTINGILPGVYKFSVQPVNALGRRGEISVITKEIYGFTAPPADVENFNLAAIAGAAHITFNSSTDLDVKVGGRLRLRHSKSSTSWNDAIDIGVYIPGTASSAVVPLLQGRYFAKWVDSSGVESVNATSIYTNAPSIINLNVVETLDESPDFNGTRTKLGLSTFAGDPALTLDSHLTIDEMLGLSDTWPPFNAWGGVTSSGEYLFSNSIDLGAVYTSRITADIESFGVNVATRVDLWGLLDSLESIDGGVVSDVSAELFLKQSQDGITFSEWEPFFVGDYSARAYQFKMVVTSSGVNSIFVTKCSVEIDMPDTVQSQEDIPSGLGTYSVTYPLTYYSSPALGITAQDMSTGDYYEITNKSSTGFDIVFKDQSGAIIDRTFDYISKGY